MNLKRWIALGIAAFLLVFSIGLNLILSIFSTNFFSQFESLASTDIELMETVIEPGSTNERIAYLSVNGVIQDLGTSSGWGAVDYDHQRFLAALEQIRMDDTVKGIVLYVNSPGGGAIESAEVHKKLVEIKEERGIPIYVSMGNMAASGGYYISAPADKIYAHRETITGSIGVIIQSFNYAKLAENIGIEFETIKSGAHKDMFGGARPSTEEELAMIQEMIDDSYEVFVDVVAEGRGMSETEVKKVADGRILGGKQAIDAGLVDELGNVEDAIASLRGDYGLEDAQLFEYDMTFSSFGSLFGMKVSSFFGPSPEERMFARLLSSYDAPRLMYIYGEY